MLSWEGGTDYFDVYPRGCHSAAPVRNCVRFFEALDDATRGTVLCAASSKFQYWIQHKSKPRSLKL